MHNVVTQWTKDGDWKARYSKLYSTRSVHMPREDKPNRISFLSNESTPYTSLLMRMRACRPAETSRISELTAPSYRSWMSHQSDLFKSPQDSPESSKTGVNDTLLLDLVRARNRVIQEEAMDRINLPRDDVSDDDASSEACVHGLSMRMTERSVSRSRVSRISTRRDMDIPSILAFTTNIPAPIHLEIPVFKKIDSIDQDDIPRWSIRRSVCPVCSQKWKDRSSVTNVKYSGLKRNSSLDLPSVIAPARLRTSITMDYVPRPALAVVDEDAGLGHGGLRNTSASWQLTRARRFRIPKPQMPSPEATAPPSSTAPLARKDLDIRVSKFLTDEDMKLTN